MTADLGMTAGQIAYAKQIISIGKQRKMSDRDIITALTVALDESGLQDYANSSVPSSMSIPHDAVGSDHASVGIFQQQVGIWGTAAELMNPATAASDFYTALAAVKSRNTMTIPQAAQTVQKSGTPDGSNYAAQVDKATQLFNSLNGSSVTTASDTTSAHSSNVLVWISTPDNWKRIGVFTLGAALLYFVAWTLLSETQAVKTALHMAGKII